MRKFIICFLSFVVGGQAWAVDPWNVLHDKYKGANMPVQKRQKAKEDPWARLRAVYLPFTEEMETVALTDKEAGRQVSAHLRRVLCPYEDMINEAVQRFNIPKEIIVAVIMVESGGNLRARAKTSSAKGLMQTIAGTFREARQGLLSQEIRIPDNPFDPRASIMAGSWYLDKMYDLAADDGRSGVCNRRNISSWRYPVEYYYAGPGNGRKDNEVVIIYADSRRVVVDKPAYSRKVMRWARIMSEVG